MRLYIVFFFSLFAFEARAADFPKLLSASMSSGISYQAQSIENSLGESSYISSAPILFLAVSSDLQISDYVVFKPYFSIKQLHYNNSPYYKIIEEKNFLLEAAASVESKLSRHVYLETGLVFKERSYFEEKQLAFKSHVVGNLGASFKLAVLVVEYNSSKFYTSLSYSISSPQNKKHIETYTGDSFGLTLKHVRKKWPDFYCSYEHHQQKSNLFEQISQTVSLGVSYEF